MSDRLEDLDESVQPVFLAFWEDLNAEGAYTLWCTRRNLKEQQEAHASGASKCDGVKSISLHQAGLAMDVVVLDEQGNPT